MAQSAPAASALARSPEYLMPPSAMTGVSLLCATSTASMMAVSWGTPTPATMRVVQIEPGPIPTLIASAPASISALAPSPVAMLPATTCTAFDARHGVEHRARMAVRGVDDHEIDARRDQPGGAIKPLVADGGRGGDAQTPLFILAGVRVGHRLLDVLHRDQPDAAILVVDHEQLFDPVLMEEPLGVVLSDALAHGDEPLLRHQLRHLLARVGGESHVAVGQDPDELAGAAVAAALHHRDA